MALQNVINLNFEFKLIFNCSGITPGQEGSLRSRKEPLLITSIAQNQRSITGKNEFSWIWPDSDIMIRYQSIHGQSSKS